MTPLPPAERARIAAQYGVTVPDTITIHRAPIGYMVTAQPVPMKDQARRDHRIRARLRKFDLAGRQSAESAGIDAEIRRMRAAGMTHRQIGERLRLTEGAVTQRVRRMGISGSRG